MPSAAAAISRAIHHLILALWVGFGLQLAWLKVQLDTLVENPVLAERVFLALEASFEPYALAAFPLLALTLRVGWPDHRLRFRFALVLALGAALASNRFLLRPRWEHLRDAFQAAAQAGEATGRALDQMQLAETLVLGVAALQGVLAALLVVGSVLPGSTRRRVYISL